MVINLDEESFLDVCNISRGTFSPLSALMSRDEFTSVVYDYKLRTGNFFPFPISLDLGVLAPGLEKRSYKKLLLHWHGESIGHVEVDDVFDVERTAISEQLFGTIDTEHPGVKKFVSHSGPFVGGTVHLKSDFKKSYDQRYVAPDSVAKLFREREWKTVIGFATRNVPHLGHEFLIRRYETQADGVLIQPTISQKETGTYTEEAIQLSFEYLIKYKLRDEKYFLSLMPARSLKAGPREALLQATIRRNSGCSHFIIGRDHSGVGGFYGKYEAQKLAARFADELGIEIINAREPYYCGICGDIVSDEFCNHGETNPDDILYISSLNIRTIQQSKGKVERFFFDHNMAAAISHVPLLN